MRRPSSPAQAVVEEAVLFSHLRNAFVVVKSLQSAVGHGKGAIG